MSDSSNPPRQPPHTSPVATSPMDKSPAASATDDEIYRFQFRGNVGEYYKIWLTNMALTLLTFGVFSAWAKVRSKRYFYANTFLDGVNFEYHAAPLSILAARLIIAAVIIGGSVWVGVHSGRDFLYTALLAFLLPWALVRGLAFNARNSSYRNIRFSFAKEYRRMYWVCSSLITLYILPYYFVALGSFSVDFRVYLLLIVLCIIVGWILLTPIIIRAHHHITADCHAFSFAKEYRRMYYWVCAPLIALYILPYYFVALGSFSVDFRVYSIPIVLCILVVWILLMPIIIRAYHRIKADCHAFSCTKEYRRMYYWVYSPLIALYILPYYFVALGSFSVDFRVYSIPIVLCILVVWVLLMPIIIRAYHRIKADCHAIGGKRFAFNTPPLMKYYKIIGSVSVFYTSIMITAVVAVQFGLINMALTGFLLGISGILLIGVLSFFLFWNHLTFPGGAFRFRVSLWKFTINIQFVNLAATLLSFGLLYPWAKIRKTKFLADNIYIVAAPGAMEKIIGRRGDDEAALGEELEAAEGFDFDVGLI